MGLIGTQVLGFGQQKKTAEQKADPKPVTGVNWLGQPMREGDFYGGRPEHCPPPQSGPKGGQPTKEMLAHPLHKPSPKTINKGVGKGRGTRTPEFREEMRRKMQAWWAKKRAQKAQQSGGESG